MNFKRIIFTIPPELAMRLNESVAKDYKTRSAYIREAILLKIQLEDSIENSISSRDSMEHLVRNLHIQRTIRRRINRDK
jgi:metal-responsive CopG/Arc/MetJ family transcriptional regulator